MNIEKELYLFCERYIQEYCNNKDTSLVNNLFNFIKIHFIRLYKQLLILENLYSFQGKNCKEIDRFVEVYFYEEIEKELIKLLKDKVSLDSFIGFFHFLRPELNLIL